MIVPDLTSDAGINLNGQLNLPPALRSVMLPQPRGDAASTSVARLGVVDAQSLAAPPNGGITIPFRAGRTPQSRLSLSSIKRLETQPRPLSAQERSLTELRWALPSKKPKSNSSQRMGVTGVRLRERVGKEAR